MFNNLIESSSHAREFKRRGSFLLYTTAAYALFFIVAGIASVYAYDAHLEEQTEELTFLNFAPLPQPKPVAPASPTRPNPPSNSNPHVTVPTRPILYESPGNPFKIPDHTSVGPVPIPPAPRGAIEAPFVSDPRNAGSPSTSNSGPGGPGNLVAVIEPPPAPPKPTPAPPKIVHISKVLNSQALSLPKPVYPAMARQIRASGLVTVQILIDETGKVVSAHAVNGHPLLIGESVRAAYQARFSPTIVGETPVKVSGVITYNFVLQ